MNKKLSLILIISALVLFIKCESLNEKLKKEYPDLYKEIIGDWYILSNDELGEIIFTIKFNEDNTVSGDIEKIFRYRKAYWNIIDKQEPYGPKKVSLLIVYNPNETNDKKEIVFTYDKNNIKSSNSIIFYNGVAKENLEKLFEYYVDYMPPIGALTINNHREYSYFFTKDKTIIDEVIKNINNSVNKENEKWENLNKNSIKDHIEFITTSKYSNIREKAYESLYKLLDIKILKYVKLKYKKYEKYLDYTIVTIDGEEICKLYEFLRKPILAINNNTGEKIKFEFVDNETKPYTFDIQTEFRGKYYSVTLKPYKNKLVAIKSQINYEENPKNWDFILKVIAEAFQIYPELQFIDVDLLENI